MKKVLILMLALTGFLFQACDKELSGDDYDFSNSLPPYATISNVDTLKVAIKKDTSISIPLSMRTALQQNATVTYKVNGAIVIPDTDLVIERNKTSVNAIIPVSYNIVAPGAKPVQAKLTIVKALKQDGSPLTIGQKNNPTVEKVIVIKTK